MRKRKLIPLSAIATALIAAPLIPVAQAQEPLYAESTISHIYDGTGHGTSSQTFITTRNGFSPADNAPDDGVVSSGDTVAFNVVTNIQPGPARTIDVTLDIPDTFSDLYYPCVSNSTVKGTHSSPNTCSYSVPRGTPVSFTTKATLKAKDSKGQALTDQVISVKTGNSKSSLQPLTVVSAPQADLRLTTDTCSYDDVCRSKDARLSHTGQILLTPAPLRLQNQSSDKGQSALTHYSGRLDVSHFPEGTTFTINNSPATPSGGFLTIPSSEGTTRVDYTAPEYFGLEETQSLSIPVHFIADPTSFSTQSFKNNGTGWQPGDGLGQNESTLNIKNSNATAGVNTPNNDWVVVQVYRSIPESPKGTIPLPDIYLSRPWGNGTYFDPAYTIYEGNSHKSFNGGDHPTYAAPPGTSLAYGCKDTYSPESRTYCRWVAPNTQVQVDMYQSTKVKGTFSDRRETVVLANVFDKAYTPTSPVTLYFNNEPYIGSYRVQWSLTAPDSSEASDPSAEGWITSSKPVPHAKAVRVIIDDVLWTTNPDTSGTFRASYSTQVASRFDSPLPAAITSRLHARSNIWKSNTWSTDNWLTPISEPTPEVKTTLTASPERIEDNRNIQLDIQGTVSSLLHSTDPLNPTYMVSLDACFNNPQIQSSFWQQDSFTPGSGCGSDNPTPGTLVVSHPNYTDYRYSGNSTTLPGLTISGEASLAASSRMDFTVTLSEPLAPSPARSSDDVIVPTFKASSEFLASVDKKVEVSDPITFKSHLISTSTTHDQVQTVVVLPGKGDDADYKSTLDSLGNGSALDGPDTSNFTGSYTLASAEIDSSNSTANLGVLECTTDPSPSLDPRVNSWSSDCPANTTAIRITNRQGSDGVTAINYTLQPTGNHSGDVYVSYIGPMYSKGTPSVMAWPDSSRVVAGTISGRVFWSHDSQGADYASGDTLIPEASLDLYLGDEKIATTTTNANGYYEFTELRGSDRYTVRLTEYPTSKASGVYPNKDNPTDIVWSYSYKQGAASRADSDTVVLPKGDHFENVNFGLFARDPHVDVKKDPAEVQCPDDTSQPCDVTWNVTLKNEGNVPLSGASFTDTVSSSVSAVKASTGRTIQRQIAGPYLLTEDGVVRDAQNPSDVINPPSQPVVAIAAQASWSGRPHAYAVDIEGNLWDLGRHDNYERAGSVERYVIGHVDNPDKIIASKPEGFVTSVDGQFCSYVPQGTTVSKSCSDDLPIWAKVNTNGNDLSVEDGVVKVWNDPLPAPFDKDISLLGSLGVWENTWWYSFTDKQGNWYIDGKDSGIDCDFLTTHLLFTVCIQKSGDAYYRLSVDHGKFPESRVDSPIVSVTTTDYWGGDMLVALTESGKVYVRDVSERTDSSSWLPIPDVPLLTPTPVKFQQVSQGIALDMDGKVWFLKGYRKKPERGVNSDVWDADQIFTKVSGSRDLYCALSVDQQLYCHYLGDFYGPDGWKHRYGSLAYNTFNWTDGKKYSDVIVKNGVAFAKPVGSSTYRAMGQEFSNPDWVEVVSTKFITYSTSDPHTPMQGPLRVTNIQDTPRTIMGVRFEAFETKIVPSQVRLASYFPQGGVYNYYQGTTRLACDDIKCGSGFPVIPDGMVRMYFYDPDTGKETKGNVSSSDYPLHDLEGVRWSKNSDNEVVYDFPGKETRLFRVWNKSITPYYFKDNVQPPSSQAIHGSFTDRTYIAPTILPGSEVSYVLTGKVSRLNSEQVISNQAWVTHREVPRTTPALPATPTDTSAPSGKSPSTSTCTTFTDKAWDSPGDACDSVWAVVPKLPTPVQFGSLSGRVWFDLDRDGVRQSSELNVPDVEVTLYKGESYDPIATTLTSQDGTYSFGNLVPANDYHVSFATHNLRPHDLLSSVLEDSVYGFTSAQDTCQLDKSCSPLGQSAVVSVRANRTTANVNAGLIEAHAAMTVSKTDADNNHVASVDVDTPHTVRVTITNTGSEPLSNFVLSDSTSSGPDVEWDECYPNLSEDFTLAPGDTTTCEGTLTFEDTTSKHVDTITVDANGTISGTPVQGKDTFTATPHDTKNDSKPHADITLEKGTVQSGGNPLTDPLVSQTYAPSGKDVTVYFRVTNSGEDALRDVTLVDSTSSGTPVTTPQCDFPDVLQPGETVVCSATLTPTSLERHANHAVVVGVGVESEEPVSSEDDFEAYNNLDLPYVGSHMWLLVASVTALLVSTAGVVGYRSRKRS